MSVKRNIQRVARPSSAGAEQGCSPHPQARKPALRAGFTLIELLVVISVIGLVAALTVPVAKNMRQTDVEAAGTRQLLDDIARARQLAIGQRTTVYMVFVPPGFWTDTAYPNTAPYQATLARFTARDREAVTNLLDKQMVGYNFVSLRQVGDQPGQPNPKVLGEWRTLAEGMFIPAFKFLSTNTVTTATDPNSTASFGIRGFEVTDRIPFPAAETASTSGRYVYVPYLAFNYQGQLLSPNSEEIIPLARGSIVQARSRNTRLPQFALPEVRENPPGNSLEAYNLIIVDRLTGRARVERPGIK